MTFYSILFERPQDRLQEIPEAPGFFVDLNLDQIIETITVTKQEYNLKSFFYTPLHHPAAVRYRHQVMQDLENRVLFETVVTFARQMRDMREHLTQAEKLYYPYQKKRWFLDAVDIYCDAVLALTISLDKIDLKSRGFQSFREYLRGYVASERFTTLREETSQLLAALACVHYCVQIKGNAVKVRRYEGETDYSVEVEQTFKKFQQGDVKDYRVQFRERVDMNHVEAKVLELVALLYPETFASLDEFCIKYEAYLDDAIAVFDREVQFYIAYLEYMDILKRHGLKFCYPKVSNTNKEVYVEDGFDLALAYQLMRRNAMVVCNSFYLKDSERIIVVSGPNQGGKTTFARMFGQLHYLASLGVPVAGKKAQLFLFDQLFTHFEKEEDIANLRGKLEDDLIRMRQILEQATPSSIIIMNEIFTSTTLEDAIFLSKKIIEEIIRLDALCVCVTFIDELASLSEKTVSMVSTVVPENPAQRTYKILRKPADGLAFALSIAEKHRLTYQQLQERIKR
jgi:DNA mismatch repair protein MutS